MQERENVHRGGARVTLCALAAALFAVMWASVGATCGIPITSFEAAGGRAGSARFRALAPLDAEGFAGGLVSFADPYMLDGLTETDALAEVSSPRMSAAVDWRHLGHPLYREDALSLALGSRLPLGALECGAAAAVERSVVRGFPAQVFESISLGLGWAPARAFELSLACSPFDTEPGAGRVASGALALRAAPFSLLVERCFAGPEKRETRLALRTELDDKVALLAGYRSRTGELLAGIAVRARSTLLVFSWSYNPVLGETFSAGLGRWRTW